MNTSELYTLRSSLQESGTLICFNGAISRTLLEEVGHALRRYLEADHAKSAAAFDVFSVYIEVTQNIRHYAAEQGYTEPDSVATIVISHTPEGQYIVSAGNVVEREHGLALLEKIRSYSALDKAELKAAYKAQMRQPRDSARPERAGLGLIDVARRASAPPEATLSEHANGRAFFSLSVTI